ncbi:MAG: iron ABC transporter permease, partial [Deltaproteobacteria bacterium]|nr:iron ABC transporter permease [Deltaproteobacteria bacterium]
AWTFLLDPFVGALNYVAQQLPFIEQRPFNIYSVEGIVWVHLMGNAISVKVMLLTPAFRNMNLAFEDAAAVSGATRIMTLTRVTLPLMVPPMT